MARCKSKMQPKTSSPQRSTPNHNETEKIGSHQLQLSEMILAEVKKRDEVIGKIISQVKKWNNYQNERQSKPKKSRGP